jgi:hypothetical protein
LKAELSVDVSYLVFLGVAVIAGFLGASLIMKRTATAAAAAKGPAPAGKIVYQDAPTVRVVDSQRVDRLRKVVRLKAGEQADIIDTPNGLRPRLRVSIRSIDSTPEAVHLTVEFGDKTVSCGPAVSELNPNEFSMPKAGRDEPRSSVFHYHESGDALELMRLKIRNIDLADQSAEVDALYVNGRWPSV